MNLKCECYIHSLKQGEKNVLGEDINWCLSIDFQYFFHS